MKTENFIVSWKYPDAWTNHRNTVCVIDAFCVPPLDGTVNIAVGSSICSKTDNFNKRTGRKIALSRAIKSADLPKNFRKEIWDAYFKLSPKNKL